ncbi:MAG: SAM-dependent methyltransferase [Polyangiales bacterium]
MRAEEPSRTAEYVALFRAIESSLPRNQRLFEDPYARRFLSPRLAFVVWLCRLPGVPHIVSRFIDRRWAGARSSAVARTRFIDDAIDDAVDRGIEQLVILGAGFDSRAYRLRSLRSVTVFEVDHPSTSAAKQHVVRRALRGASANVRFVTTDFGEGDLSHAMHQAGYSKTAATFILWEGVTQYLTSTAVDATLRWCTESAAGTQLLFTYVDRAVIDTPERFAGTAKLFATLRDAGEQWQFGIDPSELADFLSQRNLHLEQDTGSAEYRARYLSQAAEGAAGYQFYRIANASVISPQHHAPAEPEKTPTGVSR